MAPELIFVFGGVCLLGLWLWLSSHHSSGRRVGGRIGAPHGLRSPREIVEQREVLEAQDLAQMLEATNARRRRRGEPERTALNLELSLAADARAVRARRDAAAQEHDLESLLAVTNARRRARGLPERNAAEVRREFGAGPARGD